MHCKDFEEMYLFLTVKQGRHGIDRGLVNYGKTSSHSSKINAFMTVNKKLQ